MQAPLIQVKIDKDVMTKNVTRVFPFEVPILQAKHGADRIFAMNEGEDMIRDFEPDTMYRVLARKHGADRDSGNPWITVVYGQQFEGRFDSAMQKGADLIKNKSKKEAKNGGSVSHENEDSGSTKD
jgi:hypothetical protein